MKKCFKCHKTKPISDFYKHKMMADGHLGKCKECTKKDVRGRYYSEDGYKRIEAYEKMRQSLEARKEKMRQYHANEYRKYPERFKARSAVNNRIKSGKITRLPCEKCGSEKSQAHHEDYSKPLEVRWLCQKHHKELHRKPF